MKAFFLRVKWLIWKEFLSTVKDPRTRAILIAPVIVQTMLFGHAATFNLEKVPYALLDLSRSRVSSEFVSKLEGGGIFQRVMTLSSTKEIAQAIDSGEVLMVVTISADFEREIISGRSGKLQIITDGRNTMTAAVANGYLGRIVDNFSGAKKIRLETVAWFNTNLITRWNFLPGLMGLLSLIQVMLLAGLSVAREREQGTFDQLLVTPLSPAEILIGKAVIPVVVGIFQATLVFLICRNVFSIPFAGNLMSLYAVLLVFTLSISGLGLSISAISNSMQQVMVYCFVLILPMVLLSGFATPVANMPEVLQILTYADPLRFALDSLRRIYLEGCPISDVAINFVPMMILAAITLPLAAYLFRNKIS